MKKFGEFAMGAMFLILFFVMPFILARLGYATADSVIAKAKSYFTIDKVSQSAENRNEAQTFCSMANESMDSFIDGGYFSSGHCEAIERYFVKMNVRIRPEFEEAVTSFLSKVEEVKTKETCQKLYESKSSPLNKMRIKFNYYSDDDTLVYTFEINKDVCSIEKFATRNEE